MHDNIKKMVLHTSYLYSSPQSHIVSKRSLDLDVTEFIFSLSSLSSRNENTFRLSDILLEIPSLAPIITPATAGLSSMYLVATFAILEPCFVAILSNTDKSSWNKRHPPHASIMFLYFCKLYVSRSDPVDASLPRYFFHKNPPQR